MPQISLHTPLGAIQVAEVDGCVVSLEWGWGRDQETSAVLEQARALLEGYFDGAVVDFAALAFAPQGTAYRQAVWAELGRIPFGQTRNYAQIARAAGGCARSVGQASKVNPIPILIPCHRLVAAAGLGGYSGEGGSATKQHLLAMEAAALTRAPM